MFIDLIISNKKTNYEIKYISPSKPANASLSTYAIWFPSSSNELSKFKCRKTLAGTFDNWLWAKINESRFFKPKILNLIKKQKSIKA